MKQFIFTAVIAFCFLSNLGFAGTNKSFEPTDIIITIDVDGEIGIKDKKCRGISLECLEWGGINIDIVKAQLTEPVKPGKERIQLQVVSGGKIKMTFINSETGDFELQKDFVFNEKIANALGYKNITLLQGKYRTAKNRSGFTEVIVDARLK